VQTVVLHFNFNIGTSTEEESSSLSYGLGEVCKAFVCIVDKQNVSDPGMSLWRFFRNTERRLKEKFNVLE